MKYLAHYDKDKGYDQTLSEHLKAVAEMCTEMVPNVVKFKDIDNDIIKCLAYNIGFFHDIGKYSDYFQEYLVGNYNGSYKNHAHISACFSYLFLLDEAKWRYKNEILRYIVTYLCYIVVRMHHLSLTLDRLFTIEGQDLMWQELNVIRQNIFENQREILADLSSIAPHLKDFDFSVYLDLQRLKKNKHFINMPQLLKMGRFADDQWYFFLIYMFSLLVDSDKLNSAELVHRSTKSISPSKVVNYLAFKDKGNVDKTLLLKRENARSEMINIVDSLTDEQIKNSRFFIITAPTGIGKTLSSLQCALRLQQRIQDVEGYVPRIITAIPFINIIEQTRKEYENVIGDQANLVVHHRLADITSNIKVDEIIPVSKALLEMEAWEGDVILTTFVQLFQSIFTGRNSALKKLNKLAGSIVILDEVQAVPEKYMSLVGATLQKISEYYGTRFILMTATQPKILEFGDQLLNNHEYSSKRTVDLFPSSETYFGQLKRTKFVPVLEEEMDTDKFIEFFMEKWNALKSAVIVVNTIKRSVEVFYALKSELKRRGIDTPVYYLSTNIIPIKRMSVIQEVNKLLKANKSVILVSTQTIEAGVDLDFDMAFRDFAPLDSLVQTAGRVNRNGQKGQYLPVYIIKLAHDSDYIYHLFNRKLTMDLLRECTEVYEWQYKTIVNRYYDKILNLGIPQESKNIWNEGILKLDFNKIQEFKLIEDLSDVYDVYVEKDENATFLANEFENVIIGRGDYANCNSFERKALLRNVMAKMNDYIIQVKGRKVEKNLLLNFENRNGVQSSLRWISPKDISKLYDEETGFKFV
ncbi:CRISPR-associated helicase, Cas3 family [Caldanaerobius fijiensis DSM 17918]|uniref:CRISPR-associated helicase, Cas3 family n=1 Tax=Caldanaerobius fijiensis DSM 17918 TaxID=1121256 RepID=A0A1M5BQ06_9THEO|nr:CRISPR-associated helicase/endonuclease Cas3 [Caldanaerobius fijiensis]SHF44491.1 CRISPR-associated helicase, Cas3 family [Caldanaerobius fijiensis DSM 17918]